MPDTEKMECDSCHYAAGDVRRFPCNRITDRRCSHPRYRDGKGNGPDEDCDECWKNLCGLCAGTLTGNSLDYPEHYRHDYIAKAVCFVGNVILDEIRSLHTALGRPDDWQRDDWNDEKSPQWPTHLQHKSTIIKSASGRNLAVLLAALALEDSDDR